MRSDAFQEKLVRTVILILVLAALALVALSSPAQAGHDDRRVSLGVYLGGPRAGVQLGYEHHDHGHHHPHYYSRYHHHHHPRFVVPARIVAPRWAYYDSWYAGRVYVPAHRHFHRVYSFPAYAGGVVTYRPHAYCGERLYVAGDLAWRGGYARVHYDD